MSESSKSSKIIVCVRGKKCPKRGSKDVCAAIEEEVKNRGLSDSVTVKQSGCLDLCKKGPSVVVMPGKTKYGRVQKSDAAELVKACANGQSVDRLRLKKKKKK